MEEYKISNEYLLQAIWGGYMCNNGCLKNCNGYVNSDDNNYGRGLIEYCVATNFNIHRVPGYEPYYIKDGTMFKMFHEYGNLDRSKIEEAFSEMDDLYKFTQKELLKSPLVIEGKIKLVRSLRPYEIEYVTPQLVDKKERILMPVNIINSYAHDGRYYGYGSSMSIVREIDVEKIVMYDECLYHPPNVCANQIHGGEYEVWVMEDDIFGKIELDRSCFRYETLSESSNTWRTFETFEMPPHGINASLYSDERKIPRPCEYNDCITKWVIKRNKKKIEELYNL